MRDTSMLAKVDYVKSIFKINTDNPYAITDIAEEIKKIDSFDDFREWLKANLNHLDIEYLNSFSKFIFLVRMYRKKKLELENKDRIQESKTFAKLLVKKVKQVAPIIEKNELAVKSIRLNGEQFFSDFELSQIGKLGGLSACVNLQKSVSGNDRLEEKLIAIMFDLLVDNIIEYKPQKKAKNKVTILIDEVIKKI